MILVIEEIKGESPIVTGTISFQNGDLRFTGKGESLFRVVREEYDDAPKDIPSLLRWMDEKFNGNYFACSIE